MEDAVIPQPTEPVLVDDITRAFTQQRAEMEAFLAAERQRLSAAESKLAGQIQSIVHELGEARSEVHRTQREQEARSQRLAQEAANIAQLIKTFEATQGQWREACERMTGGQQRLAEQIQSIVHELGEARSEIRRTWEEQEARSQQPAQETANVAQLTQTFESAQEQCREVCDRMTAGQERLVEQIQASQEAMVRRLDELVKRVVQAKDDRGDMTGGQQQLAEQIRAGQEAMVRRLDELVKRVAQAKDDRGDADGRYEAALEEVQRLTAQNERLEQQLAERRAGGAAPGTLPSGATDWESQKKRLLSALEDLDESDEEEAKHRISIEKLVRTTDAFITAKNQEIAELRRLVEQQRGEAAPPAASTLTADEALDQDSVIQAERENLRRLQKELEEKLRQAEVEVSIERADIARQRAEIEEIMRQFAEEAAASSRIPAVSVAPEEKPSGRRWLTRLGLKKQGEENG